MNFNLLKRAHESKEHVQVKHALANLLRKCGWIVLVEALYVDLTAFHHDIGILWALEIERSVKLIRHNAEKAFAYGADRLLIILCDCSLVRRTLNILAEMPPEIHKRTLVVIADEVNEAFVHQVMEQCF